MAMIETARPAPFGAVTVYKSTVKPLENIVSWFRARRDAVRTYNALAGLSHRQLDDIGFTEMDIESYRQKAGLL